jgi:murein endopeptidase
VLSRLALILLAAVLAALGMAASSTAGRPGDYNEPIQWRTSRSLGKPWDGRLVNGMQLPESGSQFFTWDPVLKRSPNRSWRRWGSDRLIRMLFDVLDGYFAANPFAPRVGIGDLSRPHGGVFDERFGGRGHASHQNGLDVDVYYPRRDQQELAPQRPADIDRALAQDLANRFVQAGAIYVFVGPRTGLRGPRKIVQRLVYHDDHMHVRIRRDQPRRVALGSSLRGRRIDAIRVGDPTSPHKLLVFGCIHGTECAGMAVTRRLARVQTGLDLWLVHDLNPDGFALGRRQNGRGVDLNRNFSSEWRPMGRRWDPEYSGPRPFSEPETRLARRLVLAVRPQVTIWFHQPQAVVRAWGPSVPVARRYARLARMPYRSIRWPPGTGPNWQNHRFPGTTSFVVELPAGRLPASAAARHAAAVLGLAR